MLVPGAIESAAGKLREPEFIESCRIELNRSGALVVDRFFPTAIVEQVRGDALAALPLAYFRAARHNVFLDEPSPPGRVRRAGVAARTVTSSKGCLTDDQIHRESPLREIYESSELRRFLCSVLEVEALHPYADELSSINIHFHLDGQELGWHFDNSSFAVTMPIQAASSGGAFEFVPDLMSSDGQPDQAAISALLDGAVAPDRVAPRVLDFDPGALVLFRGRGALHRVTPSIGPRARILVVFAFNTEPGVALSPAAMRTFYGRES